MLHFNSLWVVMCCAWERFKKEMAAYKAKLDAARDDEEDEEDEDD